MSTQSEKKRLRALIREAGQSVILLEATARFMRHNHICREYISFWHDTECDGNCLMEDCENQALGLRDALGVDAPRSEESAAQKWQEENP